MTFPRIGATNSWDKRFQLNQVNQFNASGSLAGYLYQCRLALLLGLQMVKKKPNGHISIEKFDDIAFENDDYSKCLIQAKHHVTPKALSDSSVDVWKTIRIWVSDLKSGVITTSSTKRVLITTSTAPPDSALSKLRPGCDKAKRTLARDELQKIAHESKNRSSSEGRAAFLALSNEDADLLLSTIDLIDSFPNLTDVMDEIEGELRILAPNHPEKVAQSIEGWWLSVVGKRLVGADDSQIPLQDLLKKANEIGSWFGPDGLPVSDPDTLSARTYLPDDEADNYVKQMRLIELSDSAIQRGVQDFYRSTAQRSKWARENLLLDGETTRYDAKLKDQWGRKFDANCASLQGLDDGERIEIGRNIYFWASQHQIGFRNVVETWITAGSFQGLADRLEIGWHPEFKDRFDAGGESGET